MANSLCESSNPLAIADGDQGQWQSCVIFAFVSAAKAAVKYETGKVIDVQQNAIAISQLGIKNPWGDLVITHGTTVFDLIKKVNASEFMFHAIDGSFVKAKFAAIEIDRDLKFKAQLYRDGDEFQRSAFDGDVIRRQELAVFPEGYDRAGWSRSNDEGCACAPIIMVASGAAGSHGSHAMRALKCEGKGSNMIVDCENSWGSTLRRPKVPGNRWSTIDALVCIYSDENEVVG